MPDKFLFLVDGGGTAGLGDIRADIAARADDGQWTIWIDGENQGAACEPACVPDAMLRLARHFAVNGARRMRELVKSSGSGAIFAAAGLVADIPPVHRAEADPIGFRPYQGPRGSFGFGVPFGAMNAAALDRLATISEQFGDATLRISPWRTVLIAGVAAAHAPELSQATNGLITDPEDPRRQITACTGQPRCAAATVDARGDAALLAAIRYPGRVHVSGCAKGCAHPDPAPITLVGSRGTYGIVRNGRASDAPDETGLTMTQAARGLAGAMAP